MSDSPDMHGEHQFNVDNRDEKSHSGIIHGLLWSSHIPSKDQRISAVIVMGPTT